MKLKKVYNILKEFASDTNSLIMKYKITIIISTFICAIIFAIISFNLFIIHNGQSTPQYTLMQILSSIYLALGLLLIINDKTEKMISFVKQFTKLFITIVTSAMLLIYWINVSNYNFGDTKGVIYMSFVTLLTICFILDIIKKVYLKLVILLNKFFLFLFPKNKDAETKSTGFRLYFERITALLVAISSTLATLLTMATTIKTLLVTTGLLK